MRSLITNLLLFYDTLLIRLQLNLLLITYYRLINDLL